MKFKEYLRLIVILLLPTILLLTYALTPATLMLDNREVRKAVMPEYLHAYLSKNAGIVPTHEKDISSPIISSTIQIVDTTATECDSTAKRILFFGDSMVEGLAPRLAEYAAENGHTLYAVCWYGSSTLGWATRTDTLQSILQWAQPDYILVSLGGNELKVTDLNNRRLYINNIISALGNRPMVWIAPPSWVSHPTITELIRTTVGDTRYFNSTRLSFTRGSDGMHPTFNSSARWMDSIATWLSSPQTAHPIRMDRPTRKYPRQWKYKIIRP